MCHVALYIFNNEYLIKNTIKLVNKYNYYLYFFVKRDLSVPFSSKPFVNKFRGKENKIFIFLRWEATTSTMTNAAWMVGESTTSIFLYRRLCCAPRRRREATINGHKSRAILRRIHLRRGSESLTLSARDRMPRRSHAARDIAIDP